MQPPINGPKRWFSKKPQPKEREYTAARAMLQTFADHGVRAAFGIPGGLVSPIFDAIAEVPEIELVNTRHEAMAAFCAMGHAIATGTPALVLATSGPGVTNTITGIAAAAADEIPLILIGGEVAAASAGRGAVQDSSSNTLDVVSMLRTVTRWSARVDHAAAAVGAARQALHTACEPRPGPVFLSLPIDVATAKTPKVKMSPSRMRSLPAPDPEACREIAERLACARRPLIVVGNGARGASREVMQLAERLDVPVVTTPHAKGVFPESHHLHLGIIGFAGHPSASAYLASRPDVVCVIGSRLGDVATNGWTLAVAGTEATFQIDRASWLIGTNCAVTLGVVADAASALRAILGSIPTRRPSTWPEDRKAYSGVQPIGGIRRHAHGLMSSEELPLKPARVLADLQTAFPNAFWACDQGEHTAYALHYLQIDAPDQFRSMLGLGSMGNGIGLGMGYRHARNDRVVICICGDGGFAMHAGEILTCVEHGIDLVLVVMNDGRYNMVHHGFEAVYGRVPKDLPSQVADIATVAKGFGALSLCITKPSDLELVPHMAHTGRPLVLDVRIDPSMSLSVATRSATLKRVAFGGAQ